MPYTPPAPTNPPVAAAPIEPAPPPQPVRRNILPAIGEAWRLPTLAATLPEPMGSLSAAPTDPLELTIRSTTAAIASEAAIFTEPASDLASWSVVYVADLQNPAKVPLATIRLADTQFSFGWNVPLADTELRRQVANCRLELRHGNDVQMVQLRPIAEEQACKLDLSKDAQLIEFPVADLPKLDLLRLELVRLDNFPGQPKLASPAIALGKETKIDFSDPDGAEISVRFAKLATGNLTIRLEPTFRESASSKFDMTLPRLAAMEQGATKALQEAQAELPQKMSLVRSLQSQLQDVRSQTARTLPEQAALQQAEGSLRSKLSSAASRVSSLQKQIPQHEARLAAVPAVRSFLTALHGNATVRFRIVAEAGDNDLVLVDGMSDAAE